MKIFFGFPNTDEISKLSPALQAKGINMLKASPANVLLKGLYQIEQPGYQQYASHLPAFLYATDSGKRVPITREGYPVLISAEKLIPLSFPSITVSYKGKGIPDSVTKHTVCKEVVSKAKQTKTYTADYAPGLYMKLRHSGFETNQFPLANTVSVEDLPFLITIIRILSSFLRVHKYPAYDDMDELVFDMELRHEKVKRDLTAAEIGEADFDINKRQIIGVEEDGEISYVEASEAMDNVAAKLHYAKPTTDSKLAWGTTSDIPHTDGIVFPYISDLAVWDKETVCNVIGRYFTRCLGHTTDGCLTALSDLTVAWKRSLHRTNLGNELSHIFRVIELAIPSQARVFPVFEGGLYTGCYMSGSGYSIALRRELFRPASYTSNVEDFNSFEGTEAIIRRISGMFGNNAEDSYQTAVRKGALKSMRGLALFLSGYILAPEKWVLVRQQASRLSYPQEYLRINMDNIQLALSWTVGAEKIPVTIPMHSSGLGQTSNLALALSAFGPSAPSPTVPGAQKIQLTPKPPQRFAKILAFRTTTLENAIADWSEVGQKGFTYNGPDNLSARYQYVAVKGESERERWFQVMNGFHEWCKMSDSSGKTGEVVVNTDDNQGGVRIEKEVDFDGF